MAVPFKNIISSQQDRKNNGGTVFYGNPTGLGPNGNNRSFIGVGLTYAGFFNSAFSFMQDGPHVKKIDTNVSFAKMDVGDFVMTGLFNTKLNRRSAYGASFPGYDRGRHLNFDVRTRKVVTAGWNYFTGQPLTTPDLSHDDFVLSGTATIDNRSIPGKFVWHGGSRGLPTQVNYDEKTG